jgi:hypothetical protein
MCSESCGNSAEEFLWVSNLKIWRGLIDIIFLCYMKTEQLWYWTSFRNVHLTSFTSNSQLRVSLPSFGFLESTLSQCDTM